MKMLEEKTIRNCMSFLDDIWYSASRVMGHNLRIKKAGEVYTIREQIVSAV